MPSVYTFNTQPVKNAIFTFLLMGLTSQADTDVFQTSVTLATGDVKVIGGTGTATNITTLPSEIGTTGVLIITLSASEMNHDQVGVLFHDAAGSQWQDCGIWFSTVSAITVSDFSGTLVTIADAVWDENLAGHTISGSSGEFLSHINDDVTVADFTIAALQQFFTTNTTLDWSSSVDGSIVKEVLDGVPPSSVGAAAIWAYASRTLTQTFAQIINAVTGANQISLYRGDTNEINLVIGDISDYLNLDFVIKNDYEDNDDQAILWIRKNITGSVDGLLSLYDYAQIGGVVDPTWANIVINDASTGDILITVEAEASQYLKSDVELYWDTHKITATKRKTLKNGIANIDPDVGNAII